MTIQDKLDIYGQIEPIADEFNRLATAFAKEDKFKEAIEYNNKEQGARAVITAILKMKI